MIAIRFVPMVFMEMAQIVAVAMKAVKYVKIPHWFALHAHQAFTCMKMSAVHVPQDSLGTIEPGNVEIVRCIVPMLKLPLI